MLTVQETQSIHDPMNRQKFEFITYIYFKLSVKYQFSPGFPDILIKSDITDFGIVKTPNFQLNFMVIRVQRHTNISKQTALLDGVDVGPA